MKKIKSFIRKIPFVGDLSLKLYFLYRNKRFPGSSSYWEQRYAVGQNSGSGSYNRLAVFKAEVLNAFVKENNISSVIEFGCGDGNQLTLAEYPSYTGLDVSTTAIKLCSEKFKNDPSKSFFVYNRHTFTEKVKELKADLSLSLDVIYHLIEDEVFNAYMEHLFNSSTKYVIVYSSNYSREQTFHERDREFSLWIDANKKNWRLIRRIDNKYRFNPADPDNTSRADFFIYEKIA